MVAGQTSFVSVREGLNSRTSIVLNKMGKDLLEIGKKLIANNLISGEYKESRNVLMQSLSSCDACPIKNFCSITKLMKPKDKLKGCREIRSLYKENFESWGNPILQLRIRLADIKLKIQQQSIIDIEKGITMSKRMKLLLDLESRYIDKLLKYCPPDRKDNKEIGSVIEMSGYDETPTEEVQEDDVQGTQDEEGRESGTEAKVGEQPEFGNEPEVITGERGQDTNVQQE